LHHHVRRAPRPAGGCPAGKGAAFSAVGAMLLGVIVTGLFVAISMTFADGLDRRSCRRSIDPVARRGYITGKRPPPAAGKGRITCLRLPLSMAVLGFPARSSGITDHT
jgi:hypothetical protein